MNLDSVILCTLSSLCNDILAALFCLSCVPQLPVMPEIILGEFFCGFDKEQALFSVSSLTSKFQCYATIK